MSILTQCPRCVMIGQDSRCPAQSRTVREVGVQEPSEATLAVSEVRQAMERLTRAVVAGTEPPERLIGALASAMAETQALAGQFGDETFASDEPSRQFREAALAAVEDFQECLATMLAAVYPELHGDDLLAALEKALVAESRLAEGYLAIHDTYGQMREAMESANQVTCVRCGHKNPPGRMSCGQCRMNLPQMGAERIEVDIIGGEEASQSAYITHLEQLLQDIEQPEGKSLALDFLTKFEQLYTLAGKQLDVLLARVDPEHEAVVLTSDLRRRVEGVRAMLEGVRHALEADDYEPLFALPANLSEEFSIIADFKVAITEATAG